MLVLCDDAQKIYGARRSKFSFASVGIQAVGRTTVLRLNYRNTIEVLSVAWAFAKELLAADDTEEDGVPMVSPESAGRRGRLPELIESGSLREEPGLIAHRVQNELAAGQNPPDIGVLYRSADIAERVGEQLKRLSIPVRAGVSSAGRKQLFHGEPAVKLVSLHSSKGLEFRTVFIPAVGQQVGTDITEAEEAKLLYVAMTRSTDSLVMSFHEQTALNQRLREAVVRAGAALEV